MKQSRLDSYFTRGDPDSDGNCGECDKRIKARRGYYRQTSYEYDEWEGLCRKCAVDHLKGYEAFEREEKSEPVL